MVIPFPIESEPAPASQRRPLQRNVAQAALQGVLGRVHRLIPCIGGGNDMPFIEAAVAAGLEPIFPRSEAGAAFIANGIAWEARLPTLCFVITSVGVYGAMQALYAASVNRRPLVLLSGEVAAIGRGSVQAGDGWDGPSVVAATTPLTAWSVDALTASLLLRALPRAVALAQAARKPVHINVPLAVQKEICHDIE